jgi:hypothetical protein
MQWAEHSRQRKPRSSAQWAVPSYRATLNPYYSGGRFSAFDTVDDAHKRFLFPQTNTETIADFGIGMPCLGRLVGPVNTCELPQTEDSLLQQTDG